MRGMIDSHAHLCGKELFPGWREIAQQARQAGIEKIMIICRTVEEAKRAFDLAGQDSMFDGCIPTISWIRHLRSGPGSWIFSATRE